MSLIACRDWGIVAVFNISKARAESATEEVKEGIKEIQHEEI